MNQCTWCMHVSPTLSQQEQLTKQVILRAQEAEKEINICKSWLTVLELAMARSAGGTLTDSLISSSSITLSLPLINTAAAITETVASSSLSAMTSTPETTN